MVLMLPEMAAGRGAVSARMDSASDSLPHREQAAFELPQARAGPGTTNLPAPQARTPHAPSPAATTSPRDSPLLLHPSARLSMGTANHIHDLWRAGVLSPGRSHKHSSGQGAGSSSGRGAGSRSGLALEGKGVIIALHAEIVQLRANVTSRDETIASLRESNKSLQRDAAFYRKQFGDAVKRQETERTTREVARVLSSSTDSVMGLSGGSSELRFPTELVVGAKGTVQDMWKHVLHSTLKLEHSRRVEELRTLKQDIKRHEAAFEAQMATMRAELAHLDEQMAAAALAGSPRGAPQGHVRTIWEACVHGAGDPRPWEAPSQTGGGDASSGGWDAPPEWTFADWLESLDLHATLAEVFETLLKTDSGLGLPPDSLQTSEGRRAFLYQLARTGSEKTILNILQFPPVPATAPVEPEGLHRSQRGPTATSSAADHAAAARSLMAPAVDMLAHEIWTGARQFKEQCDMLAQGLVNASKLEAEQATHESMHAFDELDAVDFDDVSTWPQTEARMLTYGPPRLFFATLRQAVGSPATDGLAAMTREHTARRDSDVQFTAPNYDITTTSKLEWYLVAEPERALIELGIEDWPNGGGHTPLDLGFRLVNKPTDPFFAKRIAEVNERLEGAGDPEALTLEHFCALRMYTGPMCTLPGLAHALRPRLFPSRYCPALRFLHRVLRTQWLTRTCAMRDNLRVTCAGLQT